MNKAALILEYDGQVFRPRARFDAAVAALFRRGVPLHAELSERRSLPRQRLYWAILQAVVDATGKWPNAEALHHALKIHTGFIEEIASVNGEVLILPRSTSFSKMGEQDFRTYFDAAMEAITTEVVPGMTLEDLLALGNVRLAPDERKQAESNHRAAVRA
jgi:hypothetical protein